jgi:hypothetical protein
LIFRKISGSLTQQDEQVAEKFKGRGLPEESAFCLGIGGKSRSLASLGMTLNYFFRSL